MIFHKLSFGPLQTTSVLFACPETKIAAIVDPGVESASVWLEVLEKEKLHLHYILLTHSHWDHIAGVHDLKEKTGALVYIHPLDRGNLEKPGSDRIPLMRPIKGATADHFFQDAEKFLVGYIEVEVIHTPGHSPGGVSFYLPKEKILLSGDTLFRSTIGSLELPTASASHMWPSLQKLAALPPETRVIPGHGRETTLGAESWIAKAEDLYGE